MKIFQNTNNLPIEILRLRFVNTLQLELRHIPTEDGSSVSHMLIESMITDEEITNILSKPLTLIEEKIVNNMRVSVPLETSEWRMVKMYRNSLVAKYEWTEKPSATITEAQRTEAADYIQVLKDIPQTYEFADDVVFPATPQFLIDWENGI